jgi:hypothetical protein
MVAILSESEGTLGVVGSLVAWRERLLLGRFGGFLPQVNGASLVPDLDALSDGGSLFPECFPSLGGNEENAFRQHKSISPGGEMMGIV